LWQKVGPVDPVGILDIWFTTPARGFYLGSDHLIYQSMDSGNKWTAIHGSLSSGVTSFFFLDEKYGYALGGSQLQFTIDGGNSWSIRNLVSSQGYNFQFITPSIGYYNDYSSGLYKTSDSGITWQAILQQGETGLGYYSFFLDSMLGYTLIGNGDLYLTEDGGSGWKRIPNNLIGTDPSGLPFWNTIQFLDSLNAYYGSSQGVYKTGDGGKTWAKILAIGGSVNIIHFFSLDSGYYSTDHAIYETMDGGMNWITSCKLGSDSFFGMHFLNWRTGWACTEKGYILRLSG
jgi:photosystem II stability/assembly factor-like uncharacterized protein